MTNIAAYRRRRYARGLCVHCPGQRDTKSTRCAACREKATKYERRKHPPRPFTEADVIAAIRARHLKANIDSPYYVRHHWDRAWVDPGGTIFGEGPYVKLPVDWAIYGPERPETEEVTIRVYAPARLRRRLARRLASIHKIDGTSAK